MQIKLLCNCGTKFSFDVEPVNGRMPVLAICPGCQVDCTEVANDYMAQVLAARAASAVPVISVTPPPMPAPAQETPPPPPSPVSSGLKIGRSSHSAPVSAPAPPPVPNAPAVPSAPEAPKSSGLSIGRSKAPEPPKPDPTVSEAPPVPVEVLPEDDSFEARRAKRLAASHSKMAAGHHEWKKFLTVIKLAVVVLIIFIGVSSWYSFVGSVPKPYYGVDLGQNSYGAVAKMLNPDELVVADGQSVVLHDLKSGQVRWKLETKESGDSDSVGFGYYDRNSYLHVTDKDVWAVQAGKLFQIDPATGKAKEETTIAGRVKDFTAEGNNLVVVSVKPRQEYDVTVVNASSGEAKTETIATRPKKEVVAQVQSKVTRAPTSGNLLKQELEGDDEYTVSTEKVLFMAAGDHAIRLDQKLIKTNITRVKVMRDAPKQSKLNANTSIMSNPLGVAEDVFNDIKRSDGGQFKSVDESVYSLTVNRVLKGEAATWQGEISGPPTLYTGKSVDIITGHQEAIILSKDNKLIAQRRFDFPIGRMGGYSLRRHENAPFIEANNTLYFWDKGSITAFDLPSGNKRWNYQLVGITSVAVDEGGVYVCGTTASPESIQFSEDINLENRPRATFVKLDAKSGKLDWECKEGSTDVYLTGKFLYTVRPAGNTLGMMAGNNAADHTYLYRINPRNGKVDWEYDYRGEIREMDVFLNRLAIVSGEKVDVLKFLSL